MDSSTISTVVSLGWDSVLKLMGSIVLSLGGGRCHCAFHFPLYGGSFGGTSEGKISA